MYFRPRSKSLVSGSGLKIKTGAIDFSNFNLLQKSQEILGM